MMFNLISAYPIPSTHFSIRLSPSSFASREPGELGPHEGQRSNPEFSRLASQKGPLDIMEPV